MPSSLASRQYDLVHLGATGYTGTYTLKHICNLFPTNLKWAIAGRSRSKLEAVVQDLRKQHPDREPPSIEVCQQEVADMDRLAAKTKVMISTVGPFSRYGEPVVQACANNGTGYVDATGEVPWVKLMIDKYHDKAKSTNAIIIPQCAFESAFSDLLAYALASHIRDTFECSTKSITSVLWDMKLAPSGGTLSTVFSLFELFSTKQLLESMKPYALSPVPRSAGSYPARGGLGRLSGMKQVPKLGLAVNSGAIMGVTNAAIVWRTWGLFQQAASTGESTTRKTRSSTAKECFSYGSDFHYTEIRKASNRISGLLYHFAMSTIPVILLFPPIRWLLKRLVFQPGQGPTEQSTENDRIEFRAVAEPAHLSGEKRYVLGRAKWTGSVYDSTGLFLASAAKVILQIYKEKAGEVKASDEESYARREGGGILTPACLGEAFIDSIKESPAYQLEISEEV